MLKGRRKTLRPRRTRIDGSLGPESAAGAADAPRRATVAQRQGTAKTQGHPPHAARHQPRPWKPTCCASCLPPPGTGGAPAVDLIPPAATKVVRWCHRRRRRGDLGSQARWALCSSTFRNTDHAPTLTRMCARQADEVIDEAVVETVFHDTVTPCTPKRSPRRVPPAGGSRQQTRRTNKTLRSTAAATKSGTQPRQPKVRFVISFLFSDFSEVSENIMARTPQTPRRARRGRTAKRAPEKRHQ